MENLVSYFQPESLNTNEIGHVINVPGFHQNDEYSCGFCSVLTVVRYFDISISSRELLKKLKTDYTGTRQNAIIRTLRNLGISANPRYDLTLKLIKKQLNQDKLIIGYHNYCEHWFVIHGYSRDPDCLYIADPSIYFPKIRLWKEDCKNILKRFGIVCSRKIHNVGR